MSTVVLTRTQAWHGRFGPVLRELCRSEGAADVALLDLDDVATDELADRLAAYDVVVVAAGPLWRREVAVVLARVSAGAGLVTVRPSRVLLRALGLTPRDHQARPGYLRRQRRHPVVAGLPDDAVQVPVPVEEIDPDQVDPGGLTDLRVLATRDERVTGPSGGDAQSSSTPAVLHGRYGDGQVVLITYDLAAAVVRLRRGDPDRIATRAMATVPYRQMDLVVDAVDPACWHHPQADVHAQLLVGAITAVSPVPVPRWWYYPDPETTTVVIQDSDDDWSSHAEFAQLLASADEFGFALTIYLMLGTRETVLGVEEVADLRRRGHTFGIHHDAVGTAWEESEDQELTLAETIRSDTATFRARYGGAPVANRNHCLVWSGWAEPVRVWADEGLRMECNAQGTNDAWTGYLFGSARPLRHVDLDGTILDVFQQPTQIYDDLTLVEQLGQHPETEAARVTTHLEHCRTATFQPLSMQSHAVSFAGYSAAFFRAVWAHARSIGVPIWSSHAWALETDARDRSTITSTDTGFSVVARGEHGSRTIMLPLPSSARVLVDDQPVRTVHRVVGGLDYLLVRLDATPEGRSWRVTTAP